jgi:ribonuclease HI
MGWMVTIEKLIGQQATGTIEAGCDSDAALKGIQKWLNKKHATRAMQGGDNADILQEIRAVMHRLPEMTVKWVKVKAHRKQEAETYHVPRGN